MKVLQVPTVHLHGTSHGTLLEGYTAAGQALRIAMEKVQETAPHGRDFYTGSLDRLGNAMFEHNYRILRLREIYKELLALAEAVEEGRETAEVPPSIGGAS